MDNETFPTTALNENKFKILIGVNVSGRSIVTIVCHGGSVIVNIDEESYKLWRGENVLCVTSCSKIWQTLWASVERWDNG